LASSVQQVRLLTPILYKTNNIGWRLSSMDHFGGVVLGKDEAMPAGNSPGQFAKGLVKGVRLLRLLHRHRVRAVVINGYMYPECWMALAYARLRGVPAFLAADSNALADAPRSGLRSSLKPLLVRWFVRACHGVMPVGSLGEKYFERYGSKPGRTFVVTFETDPSLCVTSTAQDIVATRASTGFAQGRKRVLCSGRFESYKRFSDAIDAFIAIAPQRPDWDLVMAGDGTQRAMLEARVPESLRSRVNWLGMITDLRRAMQLYSDVHLLLHPSGHEPWGMVVQEAASSGIPMIASNVTGAAIDIIRHGENGFLFPVGDIKAIERALLTVTDTGQYERFAAHAKDSLAHWHEKYESTRGFLAAMRSASVI